MGMGGKLLTYKVARERFSEQLRISRATFYRYWQDYLPSFTLGDSSVRYCWGDDVDDAVERALQQAQPLQQSQPVSE